VPFKLNQNRRHHIPRQRHKVTNWPDYEASLRQRGSLTVWFAEEAIARVCGRWTHALESISFFRGLWRDRFRACVYAVTAVPGASVTASSRFGIGIPSFFSNSARSPAIVVR
jgi:hypothetical protein